MKSYRKKVQYYETDMMGMAHHANYIRWMEEARIEFLDQLGFPYARMEADGIISPVRAVSCQYKKPCTFGDTLSIAVTVDSVNGVVLTLGYDMTRESDGALICQARSEHVFMHREGGLLRMKRDMPEFSAVLEGVYSKP